MSSSKLPQNQTTLFISANALGCQSNLILYFNRMLSSRNNPHKMPINHRIHIQPVGMCSQFLRCSYYIKQILYTMGKLVLVDIEACVYTDVAQTSLKLFLWSSVCVNIFVEVTKYSNWLTKQSRISTQLHFCILLLTWCSLSFSGIDFIHSLMSASSSIQLHLSYIFLLIILNSSQAWK